jgi:hypothetical protein
MSGAVCVECTLRRHVYICEILDTQFDAILIDISPSLSMPDKFFPVVVLTWQSLVLNWGGRWGSC